MRMIIEALFFTFVIITLSIAGYLTIKGEYKTGALLLAGTGLSFIAGSGTSRALSRPDAIKDRTKIGSWLIGGGFLSLALWIVQDVSIPTGALPIQGMDWIAWGAVLSFFDHTNLLDQGEKI